MQKTRNQLEKELNSVLSKIGNIISKDVPVSNTEDDNKVIRTWGEKSEIKVTGDALGQLHHHEVM